MLMHHELHPQELCSSDEPSPPMRANAQDLDLFLFDDEDERRKAQQAQAHEGLQGILNSLPRNGLDEVSVVELRNGLMQLTNDPLLNTFIQLLGGIQEAFVPRTAVMGMWLKITSAAVEPKRARRAKSATHIPIVRSRLLESKRKQAECDLKLLENRIFLLQQEESKAWKKIVQTKDRAKEILDQREASLRKQEEKTMLAFDREKETRRAQKKQHSLKKESMIKKKHAVIQIISKKYQDVEEVKSQSKRLQAEKERQQLLEVQRAREKREAVRRQEEMHRRKKAQDKRNSEQEVALRFMKKMIDEERKIKEHQRRVEEMERAELELIKRLQGTQLIQQEAFSVLEQALLRTDGHKRPKSASPPPT